MTEQHQETIGSRLEKLENEATDMALKITEGCHPELNIAPYIELCRKAILLGCEVTRKAP